MRETGFNITPNFGIMSTPIYKSGEQLMQIDGFNMKLNSNENPLGSTQKAKDAFIKSLENLHLYPSSSQIYLKQKIAEIHDIDCNRILCGAGSDELISFICQCYCSAGDEIIHTEHGFAMYRISALLRGAKPVKVLEKDRLVDIESILNGCSEKTKVVFIANPNNPTGTFIEDAKIKYLLDYLPSHILLVLDGAYTEYIEGFDGGISHVDNYNNLIDLRTFSKIYGLAALRVGWCYASEQVIKTINQVRGPFNVSSPAIAAASASVTDTEYVVSCRNENMRLREWLSDELVKLGLKVTPSATNFLLVDFSSSKKAEAADKNLRSKGILIRKVADYDLPKSLRISIGKEEECFRLRDQIKNFMEDANAI